MFWGHSDLHAIPRHLQDKNMLVQRFLLLIVSRVISQHHHAQQDPLCLQL
jgi:hypothetical protein